MVFLLVVVYLFCFACEEVKSCQNAQLIGCTCLADGSGGLIITCEQFPEPLFADMETIMTVTLSIEENVGVQLSYKSHIWPNLQSLYGGNNRHYHCKNGLCKDKVFLSSIIPYFTPGTLQTTANTKTSVEVLQHLSTGSLGTTQLQRSMFDSVNRMSHFDTPTKGLMHEASDSTTEQVIMTSSPAEDEKRTKHFDILPKINGSKGKSILTTTNKPSGENMEFFGDVIKEHLSLSSKTGHVLTTPTAAAHFLEVSKMTISQKTIFTNQIASNSTLREVIAKLDRESQQGKKLYYFFEIGFYVSSLIIVVLIIILCVIVRWVKYRRDRPLPVPNQLDDL